MRRLVFIALAGIAPAGALAQVSVTSPRPDSVSLTIYRDNLALVTETRHVDLPAGPVTLVFEGVVDSLLARSAVINGAGRSAAATDFHFDRLTPAALLQRSVGRTVTLVRTSPVGGTVTRLEATVVAADHGIVFRSSQGSEALYCSGLPERLELHEIPGELTPTPTLSIDLAAGEPGPRTVTVSYLAHGFSWSADYVAHLNQSSDRMNLAGWLTLRNDTSASFSQAQVQVVAGKLNLLAEDEGGSQRWAVPWYLYDEVDPGTGLPVTSMDRAHAAEEDKADEQMALLHECYPLAATTDGLAPGQIPYDILMAAQKEQRAVDDEDLELSEVQVTGTRIVERVQLGDYQLYRIPWPTDLNALQTKQAAFMARDAIQVERVYSMRLPIGFVPDFPDSALEVTLKWRNDEASGLGEPLPAGRVRVVEPHGNDAVFAGEDAIKDTPTGLPVEIRIARAQDLVAEFSIDQMRERGDSPRYTVSVEASHRFVNDKQAPVIIEIRHQGTSGPVTTTLLRSNLRARREAGQIIWRFELQPGQEQWLRYKVRSRFRYR